MYSTIIYKRVEVKNKKYFNYQISEYKFEFVIKVLINKYYKNSFFYLLFFLLFCFHFQYLLIPFTY